MYTNQEIYKILKSYGKRVEAGKAKCKKQHKELFCQLDNELTILNNQLNKNDESFDIIDYHVKLGIRTSIDNLGLYATNVDFLTSDEITRIQNYKIKEFRLAVNHILPRRSIYSEKWVVDGHEVTIDEKNQTLQYMDKYNIPFHMYIYRKIIKRYLEGDIDIFE